MLTCEVVAAVRDERRSRRAGATSRPRDQRARATAAGRRARAGARPRRSSAGRRAGRRSCRTRLDVPAAREEAVDLVGDAPRPRRRSRPAQLSPPSASQQQHDEDRDRATSRSDRQRVRQLRERGREPRGWPCSDRMDTSRDAGAALPCPASSTRTATRSSARCAGRTEGGDFWAWREAMLELAAGADARARARGLRRRPTARCARPATRPSASSTTSGSPRRRRRSRPRREAGHRARPPPRRLRARRARRASGRSRSPTTCARSRRCARRASRVGVAPHSVRACPRDWLEEIGALRASARASSLHVHADEQPREIEECLAEHGLRPVELLARDRLPRPAHDGRPRDARRRRASSTCSPSAGAARLPLPDDRGQPRRRLPARRARCSSAGSASASARTRTCASTRSRSCASSRASPAAAPARNVVSVRACSASAPTKAPRRSGSRRLAGCRGGPRAPLARRRRARRRRLRPRLRLRRRSDRVT